MRKRILGKFRPFEEPMILPFNQPGDYFGPGMANVRGGGNGGQAVAVICHYLKSTALLQKITSIVEPKLKK